MQGAGAQGRRIDSSEDGVEFFEFGEAHTESLHDGAGDAFGLGAQGLPGFGEFDDQLALVGGAAGARDEAAGLESLEQRESVGESSCSACPISFTDMGARPHSASITRYCGCVRPIGSRRGR